MGNQTGLLSVSYNFLFYDKYVTLKIMNYLQNSIGSPLMNLSFPNGIHCLYINVRNIETNIPPIYLDYNSISQDKVCFMTNVFLGPNPLF